MSEEEKKIVLRAYLQTIVLTALRIIDYDMWKFFQEKTSEDWEVAQSVMKEVLDHLMREVYGL